MEKSGMVQLKMNKFDRFDLDKDLQFLLELSELLKTQDNRITSHPIFLVQKKVRDYGYDPAYSDNRVWIDADGNETDPPEDEDDNEELTETAYIDRWETVTSCFTEAGAKQFVERNGHRHDGELRIYVDSLYRNEEMIRVRNILAAVGPQISVLLAKYRICFAALTKMGLGESDPDLASRAVQEAIDVCLESESEEKSRNALDFAGSK